MAGRITYVGHATTLLELPGVRLMTDPLLRERFMHVPRHTAVPDRGVARDIDAILISHAHADHLDPPSLRVIGRETPLIVPKGTSSLLRRRGFGRLTELAPGDSTTVGGVTVTATQAVHDGRRWKFGGHRHALGYVIEAPGARIYFAGDTDLFDEMADLSGIDVALLPVAGWGSRLGWGHLDPERAAEAASVIRPRIVVP
ncbi:MAG: MBL fold metallo-hydrolase, partial [Solirubrobacterales bacterium]